MGIKVKTDKYADAIAAKLHGICGVPLDEQCAMIKRAISTARRKHPALRELWRLYKETNATIKLFKEHSPQKALFEYFRNQLKNAIRQAVREGQLV